MKKEESYVFELYSEGIVVAEESGSPVGIMGSGSLKKLETGERQRVEQAMAALKAASLIEEISLGVGEGFKASVKRTNPGSRTSQHREGQR